MVWFSGDVCAHAATRRPGKCLYYTLALLSARIPPARLPCRAPVVCFDQRARQRQFVLHVLLSQKPTAVHPLSLACSTCDDYKFYFHV